MNVSYIWTYHAHVLSVLATPSLHTFSNPKTTQNMRFGQTYIGSNDFWKSILVVNGVELQWIQWNRQIALHSAHRHEIHFKIVYNWDQARIKINWITAYERKLDCFISHVMACIFGDKKETPSYSVISTFRLPLGRVVKNADDKKGANQKKKKNLQKYQRKKWWSQCISTHGVDSNDYVTNISTFHHLYCRFHIITWN